MKFKKILTRTLFTLGLLGSVSGLAESDNRPQPPLFDKTEGEFCETCQNKRDGQLMQIRKSADSIEDKARQQALPKEDPEALKAKIARAKKRLLKKIKSGECPAQNFDEDMNSAGRNSGTKSNRDIEEFLALSADDDHDNFDEDSDSKLRRSRPTNRKNELMKIVALDDEAMEEVEDAMEAQQEKCKKLALRQKQSSSFNYGQNMNPNMPGNANSSNFMNLYNSMSSMNMMGMGNMMNMGSLNMMGTSSMGMPMSGLYGGYGSMPNTSMYGSAMYGSNMYNPSMYNTSMYNTSMYNTSMLSSYYPNMNTTNRTANPYISYPFVNSYGGTNSYSSFSPYSLGSSYYSPYASNYGISAYGSTGLNTGVNSLLWPSSYRLYGQ